MTDLDFLGFVFIGLMTTLILFIWWLNKTPRDVGSEATFTEPLYDKGGTLPVTLWPDEPALQLPAMQVDWANLSPENKAARYRAFSNVIRRSGERATGLPSFDSPLLRRLEELERASLRDDGPPR